MFFNIGLWTLFNTLKKGTRINIWEICAELENLKKLSGEKTDAKAIRFAIQNYATLNDRYIETQRQIRTWKDKYAALNKAVDDYLSSFEALKKTTD